MALALNGNTELGAYIQTMIVPVRYTDFDSSQDRENGQGEGIIEKYIKPFIEKKGEVDMIITISQALPEDCNIDVFATATRGGFNDNMNFIREDGSKAILGGAETIKTTLPTQMTQGNSKAAYWGKYFKNINEYRIYKGDLRKSPNNSTKENYPNEQVYYAPGGNYLSNEIFYRVSKLRETLQPKLSTGHFHIAMIQAKGDLVSGKIKELVTIVKQVIKNAITGL